jgi:hypothetical protein
VTGEQRAELKREIHAARLREIEGQRARARRRRGDPTCSRCYKAVRPQDLSPGRAWCRDCENRRRDSYRKRAA